jgi:hypothetical protein
VKQEEYEAAATLILETMRSRLLDVAASTGATFVDESFESKAKGAPEFCFRLLPLNPRAAALEVSPERADSIYIGVGRRGWIEVFASPRKPAQSVEDAIQIVDAIVAGRVTERFWTRKRTGNVVESLVHIQRPDGRWKAIGYVGQPPPGIRKLFYDETLIEYEPYSA